MNTLEILEREADNLVIGDSGRFKKSLLEVEQPQVDCQAIARIGDLIADRIMEKDEPFDSQVGKILGVYLPIFEEASLRACPEGYREKLRDIMFDKRFRINKGNHLSFSHDVTESYHNQLERLSIQRLPYHAAWAFVEAKGVEGQLKYRDSEIAKLLKLDRPE